MGAGSERGSALRARLATHGITHRRGGYRDPESQARRTEPKDLQQKLAWLWFRNRSFFALDEAEHITLGALAVLVQ